MSENEASAGLFSMPTLQYNEGGWGPIEISEDFRVMPYQVICRNGLDNGISMSLCYIQRISNAEMGYFDSAWNK